VWTFGTAAVALAVAGEALGLLNQPKILLMIDGSVEVEIAGSGAARGGTIGAGLAGVIAFTAAS
jgi:hypothetical protein